MKNMQVLFGRQNLRPNPFKRVIFRFSLVAFLLFGLAMAGLSQNASAAAPEMVSQLPNPAIIVTPTSGLVTTELGGTATFTVALSTTPSSQVIVNVLNSQPAEAFVNGSYSGTLLFFSDTTPQTITL